MPFLAIPAVAAATIGGGAGIGAALIGRSGSKSIAQQQQDQANQMFARTQPAYNQAYNYYSGLMSNPLQQPGIADAQLQFNQARQNIINGSYSRGGGLDSSLGNLEAGRAVTLSQLIAGGRQQAASGLTGLATNGSAQGLQALAGAQASQSQNAMTSQQAMTGIGSFLARLLSTPGIFGGGNNGGGGSFPWQGPVQNIPSAMPDEINYFPQGRA